MKNTFALFLTLLFTIVYGQKLDPNSVALQYLNDLCTLDENKFVSKYMLTHEDFMFLYNSVNKPDFFELSDSLNLRSSVSQKVLESYRQFQTLAESVPSLKKSAQYLTCFYQLQYKNRYFKWLMFDDLAIHFKSDTTYYALYLDDLVYVNNRWIGGELNSFSKTDSSYQRIYSDNYDDLQVYPVDTVALATYDYDEDVTTTTEEMPTKKQQKIQKKIDAYYRKIDLLYQKQ
jgi:hypothetical protein